MTAGDGVFEAWMDQALKVCRSSAVGLLITLLPTGATAAELLASITELPPWGIARDGEAPGIHVELLKELERRTGLKITVTVEPFPRMIACLETGRADLTISAWNDDRSAIAERGATALSLGFGVIARPGVSLQSYADLSQLTIATVRGLMLDHPFDTDAAIAKILVTDYRAGLRLLQGNRVDAVVGSFLSLDALAKEAGRTLDGPRLLLNSMPLTLQFSRESLHWAAQDSLNAALLEMRADGTVQRIVSRYFAEGPSTGRTHM